MFTKRNLSLSIIQKYSLNNLVDGTYWNTLSNNKIVVRIITRNLMMKFITFKTIMKTNLLVYCSNAFTKVRLIFFNSPLLKMIITLQSSFSTSKKKKKPLYDLNVFNSARHKQNLIFVFLCFTFYLG